MHIYIHVYFYIRILLGCVTAFENTAEYYELFSRLISKPEGGARRGTGANNGVRSGDGYVFISRDTYTHMRIFIYLCILYIRIFYSYLHISIYIFFTYVYVYICAFILEYKPIIPALNSDSVPLKSICLYFYMYTYTFYIYIFTYVYH